jgi:hypothetical protein
LSMERPYSMARSVRRCYTMVPFYRKRDFISMLLSRVPGRELRDEKNLGLCFIGRICQRRCFQVVQLLHAMFGVCSDFIFKVKPRDPPLNAWFHLTATATVTTPVPFWMRCFWRIFLAGPQDTKGWSMLLLPVDHRFSCFPPLFGGLHHWCLD